MEPVFRYYTYLQHNIVNPHRSIAVSILPCLIMSFVISDIIAPSRNMIGQYLLVKYVKIR